MLWAKECWCAHKPDTKFLAGWVDCARPKESLCFTLLFWILKLLLSVRHYRPRGHRDERCTRTEWRRDGKRWPSRRIPANTTAYYVYCAKWMEKNEIQEEKNYKKWKTENVRAVSSLSLWPLHCIAMDQANKLGCIVEKMCGRGARSECAARLRQCDSALLIMRLHLVLFVRFAHAINNNVVRSSRFGARDTTTLLWFDLLSLSVRVSRSILVWILTYLGYEMLSSAEIHKMIKECWQKQNEKKSREKIKIKCYWNAMWCGAACPCIEAFWSLSTIEEDQDEKKKWKWNVRTLSRGWWHGWSYIIIYFIIAIDTRLSGIWMTRTVGRDRMLTMVCRKCIRLTIWKSHSKIICFAICYLLLSATFYCKMLVIDC